MSRTIRRINNLHYKSNSLRDFANACVDSHDGWEIRNREKKPALQNAREDKYPSSWQQMNWKIKKDWAKEKITVTRNGSTFSGTLKSAEKHLKIPVSELRAVQSGLRPSTPCGWSFCETLSRKNIRLVHLKDNSVYVGLFEDCCLDLNLKEWQLRMLVNGENWRAKLWKLG